MAIIIDFGGGNKFPGEGTCDGWCPDPPATPTCTPALVRFDPSTHHIFAQDGHAWVVMDKLPIMSDKLTSFASKMKVKYAKADKTDEKIQAKISAEFKAFLKTDDGVVGPRRLAKISNELGLTVQKSKAK